MGKRSGLGSIWLHPLLQGDQGQALPRSSSSRSRHDHEQSEDEDCIPYWDYDAPVAKETPRDASAAAVTAAGLFELCEIVPDGKKYSDYAEKILRSLASDEYLAKPGENCGFILKHSTGSLPHGSEIDTPLNYADYYFLEALLKYKNMHK